MDRTRVLIVSGITGGILLVAGLIWGIRSMLHKTPETTTTVEHTVAPETGNTEKQEPIPTGGVQEQPAPEVEAYTAVTILFPPFVHKEAVAETIAQIQETYTVEASRRISDSMQSYYKTLASIAKKPSSVDIVVVPSDMQSSYQQRGYHIPFKESLASLYHPLFQPLVDDVAGTYLPLRIDPAVTVYDTTLLISQPQLTLSTIQAALLTTEKQRPVAINIGFDTDTWPVLSGEQEPYYGFGAALYLFLQQAKIHHDARFLDFFIKGSWRDKGQLLTEVDNCKQTFPQKTLFACLTQQHRVGVWFGFLSDTTSEPVNTGYTLTHFPTPIQSYPMKGRGLVINKQSKHLKSALQRTKGMLAIQLQSGTQQRAPKLLQAQYSTLQNQMLDTDFQVWSPYLEKTSLLSGSTVSPAEIVAGDSILQKVIAGKYAIDLYIPPRETIE